MLACEGAGEPARDIDEERARRAWQRPDPRADAEAMAVRESQVRRVLGRRPLLKGLTAGVGLLVAGSQQLSTALAAPAPASAPATATTSAPILGYYSTVPVSQPVTLAGSRPVTFPGSQPVTFPVSQPVTFPVSQPVTFPVSRPVTFPVSPPVTFPVSNRSRARYPGR